MILEAKLDARFVHAEAPGGSGLRLVGAVGRELAGEEGYERGGLIVLPDRVPRTAAVRPSDL